jgi:uncharacterized CHY-type Zn-finger protein
VSALLSLWSRIPEQAKRLVSVGVILVGLLVGARWFLVPADFGRLGHFRAAAVQEVAAQKIEYAGHEKCAECHDDVVTMKSAGYHKNVACEVCHGPAAAHARDPGNHTPTAPRERGSCPLCHEYLASRPTGFPQIVSASHNPMKPCISCHKPHDPKPPEAPKECEACHASIARLKALSPHVYVACTHCHTTPEEHKITPRRVRASIPDTREFCGGCHAKDTPKTEPQAETVPKVDMVTHGERYVCWQCHYPHLPEAR